VPAALPPVLFMKSPLPELPVNCNEADSDDAESCESLLK
jgi:hypothetical protein